MYLACFFVYALDLCYPKGLPQTHFFHGSWSRSMMVNSIPDRVDWPLVKVDFMDSIAIDNVTREDGASRISC